MSRYSPLDSFKSLSSLFCSCDVSKVHLQRLKCFGGAHTAMQSGGTGQGSCWGPACLLGCTCMLMIDIHTAVLPAHVDLVLHQFLQTPCILEARLLQESTGCPVHRSSRAAELLGQHAASSSLGTASSPVIAVWSRHEQENGGSGHLLCAFVYRGLRGPHRCTSVRLAFGL